MPSPIEAQKVWTVYTGDDDNRAFTDKQEAHKYYELLAASDKPNVILTKTTIIKQRLTGESLNG